MKDLNHPNVLNMLGVCIDGGPAPFIVMPFMASGSLRAYLKKERRNLIVPEDADVSLVRCMIINSTFPLLNTKWLHWHEAIAAVQISGITRVEESVGPTRLLLPKAA